MDKEFLYLIEELGNTSCKLNFQETMTFIFALSFIIFSVSQFLKTLHKIK